MAYHGRSTVRLFTLIAVLLIGGYTTGCDRASESQSKGSTSSEQSQDDEMTPSDIPDDQSRRGATERGTYYVELAPEPNPVPFQELFEFEVRVYDSQDDETPLEDVSLDQVRAVMPAHGHGMKTQPEWEQVKPGVFRVRGVKFHMQGAGEDGRWVVHVLVNGPDGVDEASFEMYCCQP